MRILKNRWEGINSRKVAALFCAVILSVGFVGCSSDGDDGEGEETGGGTAPTSYAVSSSNTNMPSSGTLMTQYGDAPAGSEIRYLVDDNADTKYATFHSDFLITWNGNSSKAVTAYALTSAADAAESDPKTWSLLASNDNSTWTELDKQSNQTFSARKEEKYYEIDNVTNYRYYRLHIEDNNGGKSTQIAEWKLVAVPSYTENIDDLISQYGSGNTYTSVTPMGTQHLNDREATAADIAWLADPEKEPEPFGDDGASKLPWNTFTAGQIYPNGNPVPSDVNQRSVGDCCACAVMASMAYMYPRYIKHIIKDNRNKTYTVTLFDPKGQPVEVGVTGDYFIGSGSLGAVGGRNSEVTWATILEKAIIKWHQIYKGTSNVGGIGTEYVSAIFTGNGESIAFGRNAMPAEDMHRAIEVSLKQGRISVGGFGTQDMQVDENHKTVVGHAFTFILPEDNSHLFKMRNPWGGTTDGVMKVKDDGRIPPTIDMRICNPGAAKNYGVGPELESYIPNV